MLLDTFTGLASLFVALAGTMSNPSRGHARFYIYAARNGGGNAPSIRVFDTSNSRIGQVVSGNPGVRIDGDRSWSNEVKVSNGRFGVFDLFMWGKTQFWNGYAVIITEGPLPLPLCAAIIGWKTDDAMTNGAYGAGAITGDLFYTCGYAWYHGGVRYLNTDLKCGWLDGTGFDPRTNHRIRINTGVMSAQYIRNFKPPNNDPRKLCGLGIAFHTGRHPNSDPGAKVRSSGSHASHKDHVANDATDQHKNSAFVSAGPGAIVLCDSPHSRGPSYLSLEEGVFCDMSTKTKIPLCTDTVTDDCMEYHRDVSKSGKVANRTLSAKSGSGAFGTLASHPSYNLSYFVLKDVDGTVVDNGANV